MDDNNNKGMIFNFINIIDFLVIIFIILGITLIFITRTNKKVNIKEIKIRFFAESVPEFIPEFITIGDRVEDVKTKSFLGDIEEINIYDGFVYSDDKSVHIVNDDKKINKSYKDNYKAIELTTKATGSEGSTGMIIDGTRYVVGHTLTFRAGDSNIYGKISGFDIIE